ncbi:hypothetical protein ACA910_020752 [Epithemia clementina (nom. ined.)]
MATPSIVSMEESILAQARVVSEISGGGVTGTDLGAACASLFYHAPVLRHSHTAAALCYAGQPQTPHLIRRLAVNCPAAIPCLVRGCLDSIARSSSSFATNNNNNDESGTPSHTSPATNARLKLAHVSILELSKLSDRERQRICSTLRVSIDRAPELSPVLLKLQLDMLLTHRDPVDLACFLIRHLPVLPFQHLPPSQNPDLVVEQPISDYSSISVADRKPSLAHHIAEKAATLIPLISDILLGGLTRIVCSELVNGRQRFGKSCLLLRSWLWLSLTQRTATFNPDKIDNGARSNILRLGSSLVTLLQNRESNCDDLYCMILPCLLLIAFVLEQPDETGESRHVEVKNFWGVLNDLWGKATTPKARAFGSCIASTLLAEEAPEPHLRTFLLEWLGADAELIASCRSRLLGDESHFRVWATTKLDLPSFVLSALEDKTVQCDLSSLQMATTSSPRLITREKVKGLLRSILLNPGRAQAFKLLSENRTLDVLIRIVSFLNDGEEVNFPVVMPLDIEMQAVAFMKKSAITLDSESAVFLLQLVYCFAFRSAAPPSPFAFNPRSMPLRQVVGALCGPLREKISARIRSFLLEQVETAVPEAVELARYEKRIFECSRILHTPMGFGTDKECLMKLFHSSISNKTTDQSGSLAEQLFIQVLQRFSDQDLVSATASALLSEPTAPRLFITQAKLYEDPLAILKCSMTYYWTRPGVRRVVLFLLALLLNANSSILLSIELGDETAALELAAARDLLVVRCLIASGLAGSRRCSATVGMVRWIVCSQEGLAASLYKQGLPPEELDWLIDNVPEMMKDPTAFADLFSDRISASPTERLAIADGVLRAVVLYGQRNGSHSEALVLGSLSQLVAGFFLVLGPLGVSVSTLMSGNDSSVDATQLSKRSALRILKHLTGVRGYRTGLRNECVIALQKLHRLCKGEELVGGLPVAIGARQKGTLREIQDAIGKAMLSMGAVS